MTQGNSKLLQALWGGEEEGRTERVIDTLETLGTEQAQRQIVLEQVLPMLPEFKERREELGGPHDSLQQFRILLSEVLGNRTEFPANVNALVAEIDRRVDAAY